jgi:hypothetical protein
MVNMDEFSNVSFILYSFIRIYWHFLLGSQSNDSNYGNRNNCNFLNELFYRISYLRIGTNFFTKYYRSIFSYRSFFIFNLLVQIRKSSLFVIQTCLTSTTLELKLKSLTRRRFVITNLINSSVFILTTKQLLLQQTLVSSA